jgi:hypothetical protein
MQLNTQQREIAERQATSNLARCKRAKTTATTTTTKHATTPPPPKQATTAAPNAPTADTGRPCLNYEPDLQGGYVQLKGGKSIDQVDMKQDMEAMPDNGLMSD